jgi:two-component system response regulator RegA
MMRNCDATNRILVCDDDAAFRKRLARSLRDREYEVYEAATAQEGLDTFLEYRPGRVLVDLRMPGEGGLWLVREITSRDSECAVVVVTGFGSIATALEAVKRGAVNYVTKPASLDQLLAAFSPEAVDSKTVQAEMPSLAEVEAEYVRRVMDECGGNVSQSAKVLGVHRRSLQRKLRQTPVAPPSTKN